MELTSKQRAQLRGLASTLDTIVHVGKDGIGDNLVKQVDDALQNVAAPLKVAVMGCVVNGPGEAAGADIGVACGPGNGVIFKHGETLRKVGEDEIVDALLEEIGRL